MNFVNRAIKNVTRRLSKTILLTLTFFLIGNLVIIGLGISDASNSAKILTRQKMRAVVSYRLDYNKIYQYVETIEDVDEQEKFYNNYPRIKLADIAVFLSDERVRTANSVSNYMWYQDSEKTLDYVHLNNRVEQNESDQEDCDISSDDCYIYREPTFLIRTNMFSDMIEFVDGEYKITSGRFYNDEEIKEGAFVCLISENLAAANGLEVGDTINLGVNFLNQVTYRYGISESDMVNTFEVIGIFSHSHPITPDTSNYEYISPYENPDNMIFMPTSSTYIANLTYQQKMYDYLATQPEMGDYYQDEDNRPTLENMEDNIYIEDVTLLLTDPLDVEQFVEDYQGTLSEFTTLDANNEEFNKLAKPLDTLSMYARFIVTLVIINAVVIITLVTALTLKNREYEIGVLLSIGASKIKVIAQFFIELALVAILGFSLSVISGSLIAKRIGNTVLEYQIASSDVNEDEDGFSYYGNGFDPWSTDYSTEISIDDLINEYEVNISPLIIAEIYIMGLGIVLISVIIPSFMIMRYNPKKILMNQN